MTLLPFADAPVMGLLAATPAAGFALQNATPNIVSWPAPADGKPHRIMVIGSMHVGSAETGGGIAVTIQTPDGNSGTMFLFGGGNNAGFVQANNCEAIVQPGQLVTVTQYQALTAGAATAWIEIWGS